MHISIRNLSKKSRSKKYMEDLKQFAVEMAYELGIAADIKEIRLRYRDEWNGYYPKNKPLGGFKKLLHNKVLTIDFVGHWDKNQIARKEAIIHEFTHALQLIERRLIIFNDYKSAKWNGQVNYSWKKFRDSKYESFDTLAKSQKYLRSTIPWEVEVGQNIERILN